jgi:hypothetical protein
MPSSWFDGDAEIVPHCGFPPAMPLTSQVTVVVEVLELVRVTAAVKAVSASMFTEALAGETVTDFIVAEPEPEPPPHPASQKIAPPARIRASVRGEPKGSRLRFSRSRHSSKGGFQVEIIVLGLLTC